MCVSYFFKLFSIVSHSEAFVLAASFFFATFWPSTPCGCYLDGDLYLCTDYLEQCSSPFLEHEVFLCQREFFSESWWSIYSTIMGFFLVRLKGGYIFLGLILLMVIFYFLDQTYFRHRGNDEFFKCTIVLFCVIYVSMAFFLTLAICLSPMIVVFLLYGPSEYCHNPFVVGAMFVLGAIALCVWYLYFPPRNDEEREDRSCGCCAFAFFPLLTMLPLILIYFFAHPECDFVPLPSD